MLLVSFIAHFVVYSNIVQHAFGILFFKGFNDPQSWTTAESKCQCSSRLATWGSQSEYDRILTAKSNAGAGDVWVGLTDEGATNEGKWYFIDNDMGYCNQFSTADCDKLPQWTNGEPSGDGEDYAEIWGNNLLNDVPESDQNGYVCEFDCGGNNFFAAFTETVGWNEAKSRCESFDTKLATFGSQSEYNQIQTARTNIGVNVVWIGLTDKDGEGKWVFVDGDTGYCDGDCDKLSQWTPGEPNDAGCDGEDYAELHSNGINDASNGQQHGYVCQFEGGDGYVGLSESTTFVQPQSYNPYSYHDDVNNPGDHDNNYYILEFDGFKDILILISMILNGVFVSCIIFGFFTKNKTKSHYSKVKMYSTDPEQEHL